MGSRVPRMPETGADWLDYAPADDDGLVDPLRRDPAIRIQQSTDPRPLRNRIHIELAVPSDPAQTRLVTTVAAGGRLLGTSEDHWRVADPEGNEMVIVSGA